MLWKIIVCIRGLLTTGKQNIKASIIHTAFIQYMNCNHFHFVCMVLAFHSYTYTNDPYLFIEGIGIFHEQQIVIYVLFFFLLLFTWDEESTEMVSRSLHR